MEKFKHAEFVYKGAGKVIEKHLPQALSHSAVGELGRDFVYGGAALLLIYCLAHLALMKHEAKEPTEVFNSKKTK